MPPVVPHTEAPSSVSGPWHLQGVLVVEMSAHVSERDVQRDTTGVYVPGHQRPFCYCIVLCVWGGRAVQGGGLFWRGP
jgi:hypothetical protein